MRKNYLSFFFIVTVLLSGYYASCIPLVGSYTINSSIPASATNFQTFRAAVDTLSKYGVSGPVVFNVSAGTYAERVVVPAITGTSAVNTVTFDGGAGNAATRIVTYDCDMSSTERATWQIVQSPYIAIRNLTIRTTGDTYGWGINILGEGSNCCKIKNCIITATGVGQTSADDYFCGIVVANSAESLYDGIGIDSIEIDSNTIDFGATAIAHIATYDPQTAVGNKFRNNTITNASSYGLNLNSHEDVEITGNTITMRESSSPYSSSYGIYMYNCNSTHFARITGNKIFNVASAGIDIESSANTGSGRGVIANNIIGGSFQRAYSNGIMIAYASDNWDIIHNSVTKDLANSYPGTAALNISGSGIKVFNNILSITGTGFDVPLIAGSGNIDSMDYNIFYNANPKGAGGKGALMSFDYATNYYDQDLIGALGFNTNSFIKDPAFNNKNDLHINNGCNKGLYISAFSTDLDGITRKSPPDIGAYENRSIRNIAIDELLQPGNPITPGVQNMIVNVRNAGADTVFSFNLAYINNNAAPVSQTWTGSMPPCAVVPVTFFSVDLSLTSSNNLTVYSSQPNALTDMYAGNDTIQPRLMPNSPLTGTYTIGTQAMGSDFLSLSQAADALALRGVSGPVVFNIQSGSYKEQLNFHDISGASATNTVTFQSAANDPDSVMIRYEAGSNIPVIKLDSSTYLNFKYLTVTTLTPDAGRGFEFAGTASYNNIRFCKINACDAGIYGEGLSGRRNEIINNTITNIASVGSYNAELFTGIYLKGVSTTVRTDSNVVAFNKIQNGGGCVLYYSTNLRLEGNTLINTGTTAIGVDLEYANDAYIINNSIICQSTGIQNYYGARQHFYNNSISGNIGIIINYNNATWSNNEWRNNIITSSGTNPAVRISSNTGTNNTWDYNLYYTGGANLFYNTVIAYTTWRTGGQDAHSVVANPGFRNKTGDLHLTLGCKQGIALAKVTQDIEGNPRGVLPTLGAYEYSLLNDLAIDTLFPTTIGGITPGVQDIKVRVRNGGTNPITSFNMSYVLNGAASVSVAWTGSLSPCDTISVTLPGINLLATNKVVIYTGQPNGGSDLNTLNDTIKFSMYEPLGGHYTIGASSADFTSFNDAVSRLLLVGGVKGPVIFDVQSGVYNEQLIIPSIPLTSDVNTVTFQSASGHADSVILTYTASNITIPIVTIDGAKYIRFKHITLATTDSTRGLGFLFQNITDAHDSVSNCIMRVGGPAIRVNYSTGMGFNNNLIVTSGGLGGISLLSASDITIDHNTMNVGGKSPGGNSAGCTLYCTSKINIFNNKITSYNKDLPIKGSGDRQFEGYYMMDGISIGTTEFCTVNSATRIVNNRITVNNSLSAGIRMNGNNTILSEGSGSTPSLIANNKIISKGYGITNGEYTTAGSFQLFYNNTIIADYIGIWTVYRTGDFGNEWKNNLIMNKTDGSVAKITNNGSAVWDHNWYYTRGIHLFDTAAKAVSYDAWKLLGQDLNSVVALPKFVSDTNFRLLSGCNTGEFLLSVPSDIDSLARQNPPTIGAYEYHDSNNIALESIISPIGGIVPGAQPITVVVKNAGKGPVTSFNFRYQLNSGTVISIPWTGTLASCDTAMISFTTILAGRNRLTMYVDNPNGQNDPLKQNDTLRAFLTGPLNGVYTIGGAGADFVSFNEAVTALTGAGVAGPVTFNVRTGIYNEQIIIPAIAGASAINTITFQSEINNRDSVQLSYNVHGFSSVVRLDSASYIRFKLMTVGSLPLDSPSAEGRAFSLTGNSSYNLIQNCRISVGTGGATTVSSYNAAIYADHISGGNNEYSYNSIKGAGYGICLGGVSGSLLSDNNTVHHNTIDVSSFTGYDPSPAGCVFNNTLNTKVHHNSITGLTGLIGTNMFGATEINSNKIYATLFYAMYLTNLSGTVSAPALVINNQMTSILYEGVWIRRGSYQHYYHNTFGAEDAAVSVQYTRNDSMNEWKNNIFGSYLSSPVKLTDSGSVNTWDYNVYNMARVREDDRFYSYNYKPPFEVMGFPPFDTLYAQINTRKRSKGQDIHSLEYYTPFTKFNNSGGPYDISPNTSDTCIWAINGRALHLNIPAASVDINGVARPLTPADGAPDIGAVEVTPAPGVPAPLAKSAGDLAPGSVQTFLFGKDTVAQIQWSVSAAVPDKVDVRQYSGIQPPSASTGTNFTYFYTEVKDSSGGITPYSYNPFLYYHDTWLGTVASETDLKPIYKLNSNPWTFKNSAVNTTVDSVRNIMMDQNLTTFGLYTGTSLNNPLPVVLTYFTGNVRSNDVDLKWNTASEENSKGFEVERKTPGGTWKTIGFVKAQGDGKGSTYLQTDANAFKVTGSDLLYYRLKQIDFNGKYTYSDEVSVNKIAVSKRDAIVYPNPFGNEVFIAVDAGDASIMNMTLTDLTGRVVSTSKYNLVKGTNTLDLSNDLKLSTGIYFLSIEINGNTQIQKIVKE